MSSRIKSMSLSITVICLVIFAALVIIPFGMGFADYLKQDLGVTTPFDATVTRYNNRIKDENVFNEEKVYSDDKLLTTETYNTLKDTLVKGGFPYDDLVSKSAEVKLYELKNITFNKIFNNVKNDYDIPIMGITDYNKIRKQQGLKEIDLKNNEFVLNGNGPKAKKLLAGLINNNMALKLNINNHKLKFLNISSDIYYHNSNIVPDSITLIVPNQVLENLYPTMTCLNVNYIKSNNEYDNKFSHELINFSDNESYNLNFESKLVIDGEKISLNVVFSFISIYLGIILLISVGAILALKQISESTSNKERFDTLRKLGVKEKDMKKSIFIQVLILFSMPLILATIHSIFVSNLLYEVILELSSVGLYKNICVSSAIVAVIYGSYFFASYYESLSIINNKKNR
ncbi:FtsX-like permease family protein [Paraclostridium sp. AKS81]|uniref:FtsX-like permease family protein n=1 Tax=Paraclostridium sp. AKS81 TaxID=2876117 RepID=UPI0021DF8763|nr:FtsX-like permease family protein [Paraclostridium sp. AKS81]MCU9810977.1 hypothetical protein [Paraclostridium sp. AKS81]